MANLRQKTKDRFSYADYLGWPEGERWELIDGEAYALSPAPTPEHQDLTGELFFQIRSQLPDSRCRPYLAPFDVRFADEGVSEDEIFTTVQPDISVICNRARIDAKGCLGAPDWIIEVVSPGTAVRDHVTKRVLYERHGVREYWIVHPVDRVLTLYRHDGERFAPPQILAAAGTTRCALWAAMVIDWDALFRAIALPESETTA